MKTFVRLKWDSWVSQQCEDLFMPSLNTQDSCRYSRSDFGCHSLLLTLLPAHLVYWHFLPRTLVYTFWSPDLSLLCSPHLESLLLVTPPICIPPLHQSCCHIAFSLQSSLGKPRPARDPRSSSFFFFLFAIIECLLNISFCKTKWDLLSLNVQIKPPYLDCKECEGKALSLANHSLHIQFCASGWSTVSWMLNKLFFFFGMIRIW